MRTSFIKMMDLHSQIGGLVAQRDTSGLRTEWQRGRDFGDGGQPPQTIVAVKLSLSTLEGGWLMRRNMCSFGLCGWTHQVKGAAG